MKNLKSKKVFFDKIRLDIPEEDWYIPAIHLYFNDDLTVA